MTTLKKLALGDDTPLPDLGRNDECWCGSGKKYKRCHQSTDDRKRAAMRAANRPGAAGGRVL